LKALNSVYRQNSLNNLEVLIYDDCSQDNTLEVINDFFVKYPSYKSFTRIYSSTSNRGITKSYQAAFEMISSEYVALLEGDDYWIDDNKISKQLHLLETNILYVSCTSDYLIIGKKRELYSNNSKIFYPNSYNILSTEDLITNYSIGNFSCAVYRMSALNKLDKSIYDLRMYDWLFNMSISEFGPFIHIREPLSVYNYSGNGEWSKKSEIEQNKIVLDLIPSYKNFFKGKYDKQLDSVANVLKNQVNPPTSSNLNKIFSLFLPPILNKLFK
jgi:glycosyltransferase involved in cell wall biosynthesis